MLLVEPYKGELLPHWRFRTVAEAKWSSAKIYRMFLAYLRDSDDNGVELYWDLPPEAWPRTPQGELAMVTRRLDLTGMLNEAEAAGGAPAVGEGPQDL